MARHISDRDKGLNRILKTLTEIKGKEIAVGVQSGSKTADGKMDMARLAAVHEFGATIERQARSQTVFHKIGKNGQFANGGRFVKAKRSNFSRTVAVGPYTINIPERSFLRSSFDEKAKQWERATWDQLGVLVDGKTTADGALSVIGNVMQGDIQKKVVDGPFVPNAPATIRQKGSSKPLIDTGRMRQSIRYVVRRRGSGSVTK